MTPEQIQQLIAQYNKENFPWAAWVLAILLAAVIDYIRTLFSETARQRAIQQRLDANTRIIESLKSQFDRANHAAKVQFETEFRIYRELWEHLLKLQSATLHLRQDLDFTPAGETTEQTHRRKADAFYKALSEFRIAVEFNKPFYPEDIYNLLGTLDDMMLNEHGQYRLTDPNRDFEKYWQAAEQNRHKIKHAVEGVCKTLRDRPGSIANGL